MELFKRVDGVFKTKEGVTLIVTGKPKKFDFNDLSPIIVDRNRVKSISLTNKEDNFTLIVNSKCWGKIIAKGTDPKEVIAHSVGQINKKKQKAIKQKRN